MCHGSLPINQDIDMSSSKLTISHTHSSENINVRSFSASVAVRWMIHGYTLIGLFGLTLLQIEVPLNMLEVFIPSLYAGWPFRTAASQQLDAKMPCKIHEGDRRQIQWTVSGLLWQLLLHVTWWHHSRHRPGLQGDFWYWAAKLWPRGTRLKRLLSYSLNGGQIAIVCGCPELLKSRGWGLGDFSIN